jgi:hypothetical protein
MNRDAAPILETLEAYRQAIRGFGARQFGLRSSLTLACPDISL